MKFDRIQRFELYIFLAVLGLNLLLGVLTGQKDYALLRQLAFVGTASFLIWFFLRQMGPYLVRRADQYSPQVGALFIIGIALLTGGAIGLGLILLWAFAGGNSQLPGVSSLVANFMSFGIISALITSIFILGIFLTRRKTSLLEEEKLKQALLKAEFDSLKNQVNPHFLFNSLNILSALIPEDPENAVQLVEKLSKVFRYNLQNSPRSTIELSTELKIVESYLFIHKMRFGDNLHYTFELDAALATHLFIVPQGLLTLVENAIKHNECSAMKPLMISIKAEEEYVMVANSYQPRRLLAGESTGIGLANLKSRYAMLTSVPILLESDPASFVVKIPLLKS